MSSDRVDSEETFPRVYSLPHVGTSASALFGSRVDGVGHASFDGAAEDAAANCDDEEGACAPEALTGPVCTGY